MLRGRSIKAEGLVCSALMALMKDRVLQGYRSELDCVLGQLTRNATRFVKSGSIEVRADQKLPLNDANQVGIEFSVMDTGSGIASNDLEVIFQDGRQGSNLKGQCGGEHSSGIGLCRAKEAVNKMGGNLTVMSEVGKGSVFSFIVLMDTALRLKN